MKPRWKVVAELLFGIVWVLGMSVWWDYYHADDDQPWNVIWFLVAVVNIWAGIGLIKSNWREL